MDHQTEEDRIVGEIAANLAEMGRTIAALKKRISALAEHIRRAGV
jgi:hypothetical protein